MHCPNFNHTKLYRLRIKMITFGISLAGSVFKGFTYDTLYTSHNYRILVFYLKCINKETDSERIDNKSRLRDVGVEELEGRSAHAFPKSMLSSTYSFFFF